MIDFIRTFYILLAGLRIIVILDVFLISIKAWEENGISRLTESEVDFDFIIFVLLFHILRDVHEFVRLVRVCVVFHNFLFLSDHVNLFLSDAGILDFGDTARYSPFEFGFGSFSLN